MFPVLGVVILLEIGLISAALILYLFVIIKHLQHVTFTLGTIIAGVRAIVNQTSTVPSSISSVNTDLTPVVKVADNLVAKSGGGRRT
ncbi:MAG TPA: hypothetical protein VII47_07210 [Actinomycetota bacterium]|jgi:hypothetical protein